jgi:integrase
LAVATVRHAHVTLRRAMSDGVEAGMLAGNPVDRVPRIVRPTTAQRDPDKLRRWTADEAQRFVEAAIGDRRGAAIVLALRTGLRRSEVCGLQFGDLVAVSRPGGVEAGRLRVRRARVVVDGNVIEGTPKTAKSRREVDLDPATWSLLNAQRARQAQDQLAAGSIWNGPRAGADDAYVFRSEDGAPINPTSLRWRARRYARAADVPYIATHGARHTAATLAFAAGVPLVTISKRLGHSSIAITADIYVDRDADLDAAAADAVAALLDTPVGRASS